MMILVAVEDLRDARNWTTVGGGATRDEGSNEEKTARASLLSLR